VVPKREDKRTVYSPGVTLRRRPPPRHDRPASARRPPLVRRARRPPRPVRPPGRLVTGRAGARGLTPRG